MIAGKTAARNVLFVLLVSLISAMMAGCSTAGTEKTVIEDREGFSIREISKHGLGMAVDINTLYNPYHKIVTNEDGSTEEVIEPATGEAYLDRTQSFDYKIEKGDLCYTLFTEKGFEWGGDWTDRKDYQHFELPSDITEEYSEMYAK